MSIPLVFFCALLNLALGYELAVQLGYGQKSPALRWARGNLILIAPAPLRLRLSWLIEAREVWRLIRHGHKHSLLPTSTAGTLVWYDVTQKWLQKLHADISAADDGLMALRQAGTSEDDHFVKAMLKKLAVDQREALGELEARWRRWRKLVTPSTAENVSGQLKQLRGALVALRRQAPRQSKRLEALAIESLAAALSELASHAHAVRDALWLAMAEAEAGQAPLPWRIDPLTSLATLLGLRESWETRDTQADGGPFTVVALKLTGLAQLNREHGTRVGDRIIRSAAMVVRQMLANSPHVARAKGGTLVWLKAGKSPAEVQAQAEAIQAAVAALETEADQELVHGSAEVTVLPCESDWTLRDWMSRLDTQWPAAAAR